MDTLTAETNPTNFVRLVEPCHVNADSGHPSKSGDTPTGDALETQQVDRRATGGFQRQRDDAHPVVYWDEQRGEFMTAPASPTRPPYNARASPAGRTPHLLAMVSTTDYEPPRQKDRHEQETA